MPVVWLSLQLELDLRRRWTRPYQNLRPIRLALVDDVTEVQ